MILLSNNEAFPFGFKCLFPPKGSRRGEVPCYSPTGSASCRMLLPCFANTQSLPPVHGASCYLRALTFKHHRTVRVTDVCIRCLDIFSMENENPEHSFSRGWACLLHSGMVYVPAASPVSLLFPQPYEWLAHLYLSDGQRSSS